MAKPSYKPIWDTNLTNSSEPDTAAQDDGVADGYTLPAKWFNWLMGYIYLWINYFEDFLDNITTGNITNDSSRTGMTLNSVLNAIADNTISNSSTVHGTTIHDALDNLSKEYYFDLTSDTTYFTASQTIKAHAILRTTYGGEAPGIVTLALKGISATSNHYLFKTNVGGLPSDILPTNDTIQHMMLIDDGVEKSGAVRILDNGLLEFHINKVTSDYNVPDATEFTSSGTKGFFDTVIQYPIF